MTEVEILSDEVLSANWYHLNKLTFRYRNGGPWWVQTREVYDRGNGAAILLYHRVKETVVLTRQFRIPTYVNGNPDGMLIEACAGLLNGDDPETAIRRETEEETGFRLGSVRKVFEAYMSPGSVTEILYFFVADYEDTDRVSAGGGTGDDERIEVLEVPFAEALAMAADGRIRDGKTLLLLQHAALAGLPPAR